MRVHCLLLIALTASGCCFRGCSKPENFVSDAPATTDEARQRARPPEVVVEVERITKSSGGGGACHSAVCLIILPVLIFDAVFPEKYDLVTIREQGVETFSGTFSTGGELMTGVIHLAGGEQKQVIGMTLRALDKSIIVESARLKPGAADGGLTRVPTSLQSQHDFLADYRKALGAQKKDVRRGELLAEALQWIDLEALPLVVERLKDPAEPDLAKAAVVSAICGVHVSTRSPHEPAVLEAIGARPGPFTALEALKCEDDETRQGALLALIVAGACAEKESQKIGELNLGVTKALAVRPKLAPVVSRAARACPPELAALFALQLKEELTDRAGLSALLQGAQGSTAMGLLSLDRPLQRAAYFDALGSGEQTEQLLKLLGPLTLTGNELAQLARAYLADRSFFTRHSMRAQLLAELKHHSAGVDSAAARKLIATARDAQKEGDRPVYEVALLVLGDQSRAGAAAIGAEAPVKDSRLISTEHDLINHGIVLSGCTREELSAWLAKSGGRGALSCAGWAKQ